MPLVEVCVAVRAGKREASLGFDLGQGPPATLPVLFDVRPAVAAHKLFRRDRMTCAYCGLRFHERDLQCEHIVPESRGGAWSWMNLVTACANCNGRKAARRRMCPLQMNKPIFELNSGYYQKPVL